MPISLWKLNNSVFVEVTKREHISETALELNIAQSAISRQITLLEQELNVSLFKKQGRNITLTSEGKLLFNEALRIIEHLDSTIEQFQSHRLTKNKSIYIGYDESDIYPHVTTTYPNVSFTK